jgi:hypothetical protein
MAKSTIVYPAHINALFGLLCATHDAHSCEVNICGHIVKMPLSEVADCLQDGAELSIRAYKKI